MTLLTLREAAALLRVHEHTVRRQVKDGKLQAKRVGRQIRIPLDQFSDFVDVEKVDAEIRRRVNATGVNKHVPAAMQGRAPLGAVVGP